MKKNKDQIKLICDVGELCGLFHKTTSLEDFLQRTAEMIAGHMRSEVCSIYLYDESRQALVLKATMGLNRNYVDNIMMRLDEGLTGLALKEMRPICTRNASQKPSFRYFPGLGEERYESFCAVPMVRGTNRIGVVVIQNTIKDFFSEEDIKALQAITSQLVNTIETARFILSIEEERAATRVDAPARDLKFVKGRVGAPGSAYAEAVVMSDNADLHKSARAMNGPFTLEDFRQAVGKAGRQLEEIQKQIEAKLPDVDSLIFSSQVLMLKDKPFIDAITGMIGNGVNAAEAVASTVQMYVEKFKLIPDPYLQERGQDVVDVGRRILANLGKKGREAHVCKDRIVIAEELFASDVVKLFFRGVKGLVLLSGGVTSHLTILSRSLKLPVIIADEPALLSLPQNTKILMDAEQGNVYVEPADEVLAAFRDKEKAAAQSARTKGRVQARTCTLDGEAVHLLANVNLLSDVKVAQDYKAEGIGLYRTEFPFIVRSDFPSEEEQFVIYKKLVDGMKGKPVTFRTLDIGGDKVLSYFQHHLKEKNPFLGMRSIRFSLRHRDVFTRQIRAILRAGAGAQIRIMFPMISSVDEFHEAKRILMECLGALKEEDVSCCEDPKVGLMVELPSVLEVINELARCADFFSIGTNDFIQYMLAVDRTNEKVADLYLPHHPSVLRALKRIVDAAAAHGTDVSICGDMVHQEEYLGFLLGIGIRHLSLNPNYIPRVQQAVMNMSAEKARAGVGDFLKASSVKETAGLLKKGT